MEVPNHTSDPANQTVEHDRQGDQPKEAPKPSSIGLWAFVKDPHHSGAVMAIFTGLILLATCLYTVAALLQWSTMRGQLRQMEQQLPEIQKSADAAMKAAISADNSFRMERRRAEDQEEAVVRLHTYGLATGSYVEQVRAINSGKVKARNLVGHVDISLNNAFDISRKVRTLGSVDISTSELAGNEQSVEQETNLPLTPRDWANLADTNQVILESGHIQYENGFGRIVDERYCEGWWFFRTPSDQNNPVQGRGTDCAQIPQNIAGIKKNPPH